MVQAIRMCADGPQARIDVVDVVGPHGSRRYGYGTVHRCVRAGLLTITGPIGGRRGATLWVTPAGLDALRRAR